MDIVENRVVRIEFACAERTVDRFNAELNTGKVMDVFALTSMSSA